MLSKYLQGGMMRGQYLFLLFMITGILWGQIFGAVQYIDNFDTEEVQQSVPLFYLNPEETGKVLLEDEFGNSTMDDLQMTCDHVQCISQMSLNNGEIFEYYIKVIPEAQMQLEVELQLIVSEGSAEMYVQHGQVGEMKGIPYEEGQLLVIDKGLLVQGIWHVVVEAWGRTPITADLIVQTSTQERDINITDLKVLQSLKDACCESSSSSNSGSADCQLSSDLPALNYYNLRAGAGWCQKAGQLCDRNGNVVKLDLSVDDLPFGQKDKQNCSMAPYIKKLPQFTSLVLNDETQTLRLTDIIGSVTQLEELTNLRYLSLNNVKLQSTSPQLFCRLKNLEYLSLLGTGMTCFQDCFSFEDSRLHYLDLSSNQLGVDCSFIFGQYPVLRHLDLSQNPDFWRDVRVEQNLQDGAETHNLDYLKYLNLSDCNLYSLDALVQLGNLSSLRVLDMSENGVLGNLQEFAQRSKLQYLDLSHNQISGSLPESFSGVQGLYHLDLSYNQLQGRISVAINSLPTLQYLNLEHNQFIGEIPAQHFASKQVIQELYLGHNNFTGNIADQLFDFKSLRVLELQQNKLDGMINLAKLGWLETESPEPTDIGIGEGGDVLTPSPIPILPPTQRKSLLFFNASYNNLKAFVETGTLGLFQSKVKTLDLSNNKIGGALPQILLGFRELSSLNLSDNALAGPLAWFFSKMKQNENELRELDLGRNQLSGTIPNEVTKMRAFDSYAGGELFLQSNNLKGLLNVKLVDKGMYKLAPDYWPKYMMWVNISDNLIYCQQGLADFASVYYGINQFTCTDPNSSDDVKKEFSLIDYMVQTTLKYNVQKLECKDEFGDVVEQQHSQIFRDGYNCTARTLQKRDVDTLFMLRTEDLTRPVQLNLDQEISLLIKYLGNDVQRPGPLREVKGPHSYQGNFVEKILKDEFTSRSGWWMFLVRNQKNKLVPFTLDLASLQKEKSSSDTSQTNPQKPVNQILEDLDTQESSGKISNDSDSQKNNENTENNNDNSNNSQNNNNNGSKFQMSLEFIIAIILVLLVLFLIACVSYVCRRMLMNRARLVMVRGSQQRAEALDQNQIQLVQEINRMHGQRLLDRLPTFFFLREYDENVGLNGMETEETAETTSSNGFEALCAICLEKFEDQNEVMTLPCCHQFHSECIAPWVRTKGKFADCPICKAKIYDLLISQQQQNNNTPPPPDHEEV